MERPENNRAYTVEELNLYPYRALQQLAKMMGLPSNVKKVILVELINTRTMKSAEELEAIINRVKQERRQGNRRKVKRKVSLVQAMEVSSSTNTSYSPPIDLTPKRLLTPDTNVRSIVTYKPKHPASPRNTSDRVLRSYNVKTYKRPNYSLINNSMFGFVRAVEKADQSEAQINVISHDRKAPRLNVTARCVIKKARPSIMDRISLLRKDHPGRLVPGLTPSNKLIPAHSHQAHQNNQLVPAYRNQFAQTYDKQLTPARRNHMLHSNQLIPAHSHQLVPAHGNQMASVSRRQKSDLSRSLNMGNLSVPAIIPARRNTRNISGIYPLSAPEVPLSLNREQILSVGFRRTDGKLSKINALVQKHNNNKITYTEDPSHNVQVTIQDIINSNIDAQTFTNTSTSEYYMDHSGDLSRYYPNMSGLTDVMPVQRVPFMSPSQNTVGAFQVYYHKKIRAEQVRKRSVPTIPPAHSILASADVPCNRASDIYPLKLNDVLSKITDKDITQPIYVKVSEEEIRHSAAPSTIPCSRASDVNLPKIHDVFSKFNDVKDAQPIYVRVSEGRGNNRGATNCGLCSFPAPLERVYNYRCDPPALPAPYTATTKTVYCTAVVPTAVLQTPYTATDPFAATFEQGDYASSFNYTMDEVSGDLAPFSEQEMTLRKYHEALSTSNASLETLLSQEQGFVTIPEMVEDALELISQDGDYMERINMDVRMQCILCSWAGSKIILDNHIRREHSTEITLQPSPEWTANFALGALASQMLWVSHVAEHVRTLYILSAQYRDPDCLMASFTTLSADTEPKMGTITVYNKVTGEPFYWHGQIPELPSNMPYENGPNCLTVELSKLDLIPNSANLKLHNRSLVQSSPSKVVVGQPELNDIQITVYVKIQDL